jgi:hypothetical protein
MKYVERKKTEIFTLAPTPEMLKLMQFCGYKDFEKFIEECVQILGWLADAKSKGMAVGAFDHNYNNFLKLYHPILETISAKTN